MFNDVRSGIRRRRRRRRRPCRHILLPIIKVPTLHVVDDLTGFTLLPFMLHVLNRFLPDMVIE
jgi:hypothetical protein